MARSLPSPPDRLAMPAPDRQVRRGEGEKGNEVEAPRRKETKLTRSWEEPHLELQFFSKKHAKSKAFFHKGSFQTAFEMGLGNQRQVALVQIDATIREVRKNPF